MSTNNSSRSSDTSSSSNTMGENEITSTAISVLTPAATANSPGLLNQNGGENPPLWRRLPNTSFGIGMGLAGQAILWRTMQKSQLLGATYDDLTGTINLVLWTASLLMSVLFIGCYVGKAIFEFPLVEDEIRDGARVHFFNMPHLILAMLNISLPASFEIMSPTGRVVCFAISLAAQFFSTSFIYQSWLFSQDSNLSCAKPQFLLSTVGWFVLSTLGTSLGIDQLWGFDLPTFCLGIGLMMYTMVTISIFNCLHANPQAKGSPALFLLIAPPSIGVVAWDSIERQTMLLAMNNDNTATDSDETTIPFAMVGQILLGWCMGLVLLLFRIGPKIMQEPPVLGAYWAYVFPLAALGTALLRYASEREGTPAMVLAFVFVVLSVFALAIVCFRTLLYASRAVRGKVKWGDPLLSEHRVVPVEAIASGELLPLVETA